MQTLEELIAVCRVNYHSGLEVQMLKENLRLYAEAGFELQARELKVKLLLAEAKKKLGGLILFRRPNFQFSIHGYSRYPLELITKSRSSVDKLWVYEVEPRVFKAKIPAPILATTVEAKKLGFKPFVWFVSSEAEVQEFLDTPAVDADPAIVAYPVVAQDGVREVVNEEFGIVLGLWGGDIEHIDNMVEQEKAYHAERLIRRKDRWAPPDKPRRLAD
jgi:hypothetical protein